MLILPCTTISVMSNATVKMIENYKDSDPNFTLARQHEHHREEQEHMEKLRKVSTEGWKDYRQASIGERYGFR